jgi:hypothetical protein
MTFIQYKGQIKISGLLNLYVGASKKTTTVRTHATYLRKVSELMFPSDFRSASATDPLDNERALALII